MVTFHQKYGQVTCLYIGIEIYCIDLILLLTKTFNCITSRYMGWFENRVPLNPPVYHDFAYRSGWYTV